MSQADTSDDADNTEELLTIAQAAQRLGISERRLRRLVALPEYAAGIRQTTRQTASGTRQSAVLSPDTFTRIQAHLSDYEKAEAEESTRQTIRHNAADYAAQDGNKTAAPNTSPDSLDSLDTMPPFVAALLAEKDRRISDLAAALEHEREAHRRAETLHLGTMGELQRWQQRAAELEAANLKLIEALPVASTAADQTPDTPVSLTGDTQSGDTGQSGIGIPADSPQAKRSFWDRLLGR